MVSRATSLMGALALVAGCSFQPAGPGGDVGIDASDEDDGGPPSDADDDVDDDGVPNSTDNCPRVANPAPQRDHDADGLGDPCDPCPHLPVAESDGDGDGDGVGNACDPRPGSADQITMFDGFYEMSNDWTLIGQWEHDPTGTGFVNHAVPVTAAEFAVLPRSFDPPYFIETGVFVDSISAASTPVARQAGIVFAANDAIDGYYICSVRDDIGSTPARAYIARYATRDTPSENTSTNLADDLAAGSTFRVRASHTTTDQGCVGTLGATSGSPVLANATVPGTHVALRTFGIGARFDYLVVYQPAP